MTDTDARRIVLGKSEFDVPPLPFGVNIKAYPLARKLSNGGLLERVAAKAGQLDDVEDDELVELGDLAFLACTAAQPGFSRADFDALPIRPTQLLDAFIHIRYQTGVWIAPDPAKPPPGNEPGEE